MHKIKAIKEKVKDWLLRIYHKLNTTGAFALLFLACLLNFAVGHIKVSLTDSLDNRVFVYADIGVADKVNIANGDLLLFDTLKPHQTKGYVREIKKVGCIEGQNLIVDTNFAYSCNGKPLGTGRSVDSMGRPLNRFTFNGPVPTGKLFMIGDSPRSYDSRYYGFVAKESIIAKGWGII